MFVGARAQPFQLHLLSLYVFNIFLSNEIYLLEGYEKLFISPELNFRNEVLGNGVGCFTKPLIGNFQFSISKY